jgi:hypothetical protein
MPRPITRWGIHGHGDPSADEALVYELFGKIPPSPGLTRSDPGEVHGGAVSLRQLGHAVEGLRERGVHESWLDRRAVAALSHHAGDRHRDVPINDYLVDLAE